MKLLSFYDDNVKINRSLGNPHNNKTLISAKTSFGFKATDMCAYNLDISETAFVPTTVFKKPNPKSTPLTQNQTTHHKVMKHVSLYF